MSIEDFAKRLSQTNKKETLDQTAKRLSSTTQQKPQPTPTPTKSVVTSQSSAQPVPQPQKRTTEELFPTYTALTQQKSKEEQVATLSPFKRFAVSVYQGVEKVKDITKALPGQAKELGVGKSFASVAAGITEGAGSTPKSLVQATEAIQRLPKTIANAVVRKTAEKFAPEYAGIIDATLRVQDTVNKLKEPAKENNPIVILADSIDKLGKEKREDIQNFASFTEEDKMNTFNQLLQSGGQMVPILIGGFGVSGGAKLLGATPAVASSLGITLSATIESGMEARQVYDTVLEETGDEQKAEQAGDGTFFANVALNIVTLKMSGLLDESPGVLKRQIYAQYAKNPSNVQKGIFVLSEITKDATQGYLAEGVQESAQQIISNIATGRPWNDGIEESFALGGLVGGGFALGKSALGTTSNVNQNIMGTGPSANTIDAQAEEQAKTVDNSVDNVGNIDITDGIDTETAQIIAELPKESTVDYSALAEDVATLLQSETPETVEKALDFGYGLTREQAQQIIASAEAINARLAQQQEIVTERSLAQMDISSRLSQDSLFNKIKELDNTIETKTANATADAIAKYFNPKDLSLEERLEISERIANTPVAKSIIEEYTGQKINNSQDVLNFAQTESDFFREMAKYDIINTIESAPGAGLSFDSDTNEYRRYPSGLPSWIPDEYKQVAFANKVVEYFKKGSLPPARATREQELYDIIKSQIDTQAKYYKEERTFQLRDLDNDVAFNIRSAVAIDSNIITNDEALNTVREYFTAEEVPVVFVEKIKTSRGMEAWGSYSNGVIRFANGTSKDTPHHEAVHAFLDLFVTPQKREMYLDEAIKTYRKIHGEVETQKKVAKIQKLYGDTMSLQSATEIFAEEALADGFFEYLQAQKKKQPAPTAISQVLQDFYQAILDFIDTIVNPNSAKKLYRDLVARKRANRKAKDASIRKFLSEYERFYAGQDVPVPLVSTKAFNQDGDTVRYYSAPTRTKKRGAIELKRVKDDNNAYINSFVVTSGNDVIGTFDDVKEAERFAEQMRAQKELPSIQFGAVTSRIENDAYIITNVKGNTQRLIQEEINVAMANNDSLQVVIPKKYLRGVDVDALGITVTENDKTVTIQPIAVSNVQMYKEKPEEAYDGVAPSVRAIIGRDDILVMKDFINSVEIGEEITKAEFEMSEKIAEALDISMDRGLGKVKQYFVETLQGTRQIPPQAREMFNVKDDTANVPFEEAKKYKTAEEFVKAQGAPVYHGTNAQFDNFDLSKIGNRDSGWFGKGFYFTNSKGEASTYGKNIKEAYLNIKKPFDFSKYNHPDFKGYNFADGYYISNLAKEVPDINTKLKVRIADEIPTEENEYARFVRDIDFGEYNKLVKKENLSKDSSYYYDDKTKTHYHSYKDIYGNKREMRFSGGVKKIPNEILDYALFNEKYIVDTNTGYLYGVEKEIADKLGNQFTDRLKELGYDGTMQSPDGDEYVAFYPEQIKTKSQLIDIWNKANQQGGEMFNVKEGGARELSPDFKKKWESFLVVNGKLQSFGETKTILNDAKPAEPFTTTRVNKESKLYKRIKESIEALNESPEYQSTTIEDETAKALILLEQNPEQAKKIALGQAPKPTDVNLMSIGKAVMADALEKGDFKTASAVASSISVRASEMGSEISMLQKLDHNSTEYWLNRVLQKKKELIEKQYKMSFVEKVKSEKQETRKAVNRAFKQELAQFENEIDAFFNKITC